jgi:light-regulated signal transduction histidine kinase (bacteriophytochrome)
VAFSDRIIKKEATNLNEQSLDYFDRIQKAALRMQTLINDLLSYSRITTQAQPFVKVNLGAIVSDVITDLESLIERTSGKVEANNLPVIEADPTQIRQLFQNLISNGLKFHRPGVPPIVRITSRIVNAESKRLKSRQELLELSFEDNGIGIEERYFIKIFSVFQRLHGKDEYEGTGVGLSICHKIVERHKGQIKVASELGKGSRFIVTLPLNQNRPS